MDRQLEIAAKNNLYIGFMVWVSQFSPDWIYNEGVHKAKAINVINTYKWKNNRTID